MEFFFQNSWFFSCFSRLSPKPSRLQRFPSATSQDSLNYFFVGNFFPLSLFTSRVGEGPQPILGTVPSFLFVAERSISTHVSVSWNSLSYTNNRVRCFCYDKIVACGGVWRSHSVYCLEYTDESSQGSCVYWRGVRATPLRPKFVSEVCLFVCY